MSKFDCDFCHDQKWVCERHPLKPMDHENCPGAGMPCKWCNPCGGPNDPPDMPPGFVEDKP